MDGVSLVVAALAAGAAQGVGEAVSSTVGATYRRLRALVGARLAGRAGAEVALTEHDADLDSWEVSVTAALEEAGISQDDEVVALAVRLMALVDPAAARAGSYVVDAAGAQGMQVGEGNTQHNRFG